MELSIDTSTRYASVGLSKEGKSVVEHSWHSEQNHSVELVPTIRAMMSHSGVRMADIKAIFVAKGPGGFSALRVGISTAKSLASALNIPILGVGTLDIEMQPFIGLGFPVNAVIEAGRNRVYVGRLADVPHDFTPEYSVESHNEFISNSDVDSLFCGEGIDALCELVRESLGNNVSIVGVSPPTRRANVLSGLAYKRWESGKCDDPDTLQPLYLRSSQVNMARRKWMSA